MKPFLFALFVSLTLSLSAEPWYKWRGPSGDGISQETVPSGGAWPEDSLKPLWKNNVGTGFSSPVVSDGRLFVTGNANDRDTVYCLNIKNGKTLWKHTYDSETWPYLYDGGPNATATIDGEDVYVLGRHGHFFKFEAATGKIQWQIDFHQDLKFKKPSWGFTSAPLVSEDRLYLNVGTHGVALDKGTGKLLWQSGDEEAAYATPEPIQLGETHALVVFGPESCSAVVAETGKALWEIPWKTKYKVNAAQPIISGNEMFLSSAYGFGCALFTIDAEGAKEVWRNKAMENHFNTCVHIGDHLYGISGTTSDKSVLKCIAWKTGETLWEQKGVGMGSVIAAKDQLIVLSERGELLFAPASPTAFKASYRTQVLGGKCWTPPSISNGHLYARNSRGDVVAVKLP